MCTWENVREYLQGTLLPLVQHREVADRWLQALGDPEAGRTQGKVLATCLAIDLDSQAVPPELVAGIIDRIPDDFEAPCPAFAQALRVHPDAPLVCASQHAARSLGSSDTYARVVTLEGFQDVVGADLCFSLAEREQAARAYLDDPQPMRYVNGRLRGRRGCAWVTRRSVVEELLRQDEQNDEPATRIVGALGLYMTEGDDRELVVLTYPPEFEQQTRFAHPTSLDSRWDIPHYFMAYRSEDGFGRTYALMQTLEPCPERIHPDYEGPLDGFSAHYLGERKQIPHDDEGYLRAALERFCNGRHSPNPRDAA